MKILVTGGAGFIGSALIREILSNTDYKVVNVDSLTYAGNFDSLPIIGVEDRYTFKKADIGDSVAINAIFTEFEPNLVMHLAAESHVDRSIEGPREFIETNIIGTFNLF